MKGTKHISQIKDTKNGVGMVYPIGNNPKIAHGGQIKQNNMKNLSKNSVKLVNLFEKANDKKNETMFNVVLDFIAAKEESKLSVPKLYVMYTEIGLVNLSQSSFSNRMNWNYGTIEEFKTLGAKDYTVYCAAKKANDNITIDTYLEAKEDDTQEKEESGKSAEATDLRKENNYIQFQNTAPYKAIVGMTVEEMEEIKKYISTMIVEAKELAA